MSRKEARKVAHSLNSQPGTGRDSWQSQGHRTTKALTKQTAQPKKPEKRTLAVVALSNRGDDRRFHPGKCAAARRLTAHGLDTA